MDKLKVKKGLWTYTNYTGTVVNNKVKYVNIKTGEV